MSLGKHILILVMLFIGAFNAFASDNDYIIYSIGNEEANCKFEDNRVNCIYKDSDGFIWVGTGTTVERINGKYTSLYTFAEKQVGITPSPFLVNALIENHKHDFWVGTIQGLFRMNHARYAFVDDTDGLAFLERAVHDGAGSFGGRCCIGGSHRSDRRFEGYDGGAGDVAVGIQIVAAPREEG